MEDLADLVVDKEVKADEVIFDADKETEAALYIIRQGSVSLSGGGQDDVIKPGVFFGEPLLLLDSRITSKKKSSVKPRCTARALEDSFVGVLSLADCRQVFDTTTIPGLYGENKYYPDDKNEDLSDDSDDDMPMPATTEMNRETTVQWLKKTSSDLLRTTVKANARLEDFEEHSVLGEGQFGEVCLVSATLPGMGKEFFALKKQYRDDPSRGDSTDVIQREIDVLKIMDHPFIINFVHQYEDPEKMYILMRLVHGGELFDVIHSENEDGTWSSGLPESDAKFYSMMICDTLEYMHRRQFVFRDLKPENILIDKDGYPVICDFGFGTLHRRDTSTGKLEDYLTTLSFVLFSQVRRRYDLHNVWYSQLFVP